MGEEGMENLERKFTCGREPLKTAGQSTFPPVPSYLSMSGHLWSFIFPLSLAQGLGGFPLRSAGA